MNYRPLVVFDMDGVLVHDRSSWRIIHEAVGTSNEDSFQAYMKEEIDDIEFMKRDIDLWMRNGIKTSSQLEEILSSAQRMTGLNKCMNDLKKVDPFLAIISGGIDILANLLGSDLGISEVHSNGIDVDNNGNLTGDGILRVPLRDKGSVLRSLKAEIDGIGQTIVIGDSQVDITMFKEADLSIAFDPESDLVSESADIVILDKDLSMVSQAILEWLEQH